jgi:aryl-alcohol dehydrogenase-like predicted oxidoreductase
VSSAIVGTSNLGHLRANVEMAARGPLPQDFYAEAARRLAAASPDQ